jgi:hypothetical protein
MVHRSPRRFGTLSLAWDDETATLGRKLGHRKTPRAADKAACGIGSYLARVVGSIPENLLGLIVGTGLITSGGGTCWRWR